MSQQRGYTPSLPRIVDWWMANWRDEMLKIQGTWDLPFCFRCKWRSPYPQVGDRWAVGGWLERAHLHDFALGGSNRPSNLIPLCPTCHRAMPSFGSRIDALIWVNREASQPISGATNLFSFMTRRLYEGRFEPYIGWDQFYSWRHQFNEWWERVDKTSLEIDMSSTPVPHGWELNE